MSPVRYELGFYIPEHDILQNYRRENLKSSSTRCDNGCKVPDARQIAREVPGMLDSVRTSYKCPANLCDGRQLRQWFYCGLCFIQPTPTIKCPPPLVLLSDLLTRANV
jgi:hypothetical protein